jgi:hypothetical protein
MNILKLIDERNEYNAKLHYYFTPKIEKLISTGKIKWQYGKFGVSDSIIASEDRIQIKIYDISSWCHNSKLINLSVAEWEEL